MRGWDEQKGLMVQEKILFFWSPEWFGNYSLKPAQGLWGDWPSFPSCRGAVGARMALFKELSPSLKSQIPAPAAAPSLYDPQLLLIFKGWAEGSGCSKGSLFGQLFLLHLCLQQGRDERIHSQGRAALAGALGLPGGLCVPLVQSHPPGPVLLSYLSLLSVHPSLSSPLQFSLIPAPDRAPGIRDQAMTALLIPVPVELPGGNSSG